MTREEKLETIVKLFSKAMFYGDWEWETPNERTIEMLMIDVGYYPYKDEDDMIVRSSVDEDLYQQAINLVPRRQSTGENQTESSEEPILGKVSVLSKQYTNKELIGKQFTLELGSTPTSIEVIEIKGERVIFKYLSSYAGRVGNFDIYDFQYIANINII